MSNESSSHIETSGGRGKLSEAQKRDLGQLTVLYAILIVAFISRLVDGFVAHLHLVDGAFFLALFLLVLSARRLTVPVSWILCVLSLYVGALIGLVTPDIHTNFAVMPVILAYHSVTEFLIASIYETRYIVAMGVLLGCGLLITTDQWERLVSFILILLTGNALFIVIEYLSPRIHTIFIRHAGYAAHFSFAYRGVSLLMNAYDASMSMIFLTALSTYVWVKTRQTRYAILVIIASISTLLLGTRSGYIGIAGYFVWLSLLSPVSLRRRITRMLLALFGMAASFAILALTDAKFRKIIISIGLLSDSKGSAQLHLALFLHSLHFIMLHPFGLGLGKTNFGALTPGISYEPESYALAIGLDGGLVALICFYYYNAKVFLNIQKSARPGAYAIAALGLTLISLSWINIQVFGSSFVMVFLPIIVAGFMSAGGLGEQRVVSQDSTVWSSV